METFILGIGWVTSEGIGWGESGQFSMNPGPLPSLTRKDVFKEPNQRFGRQSEFSRLGFGALVFALRDAGLETWSEKRAIGVIAGSRFGCLATDKDYFQPLLPEGDGLPSPNLFAYTLANCFMGEAAIQFGLTGSTMVINEADPSGLAPLTMALESISWGEHETMLAGICDLPAPEPFEDLNSSAPGALFMVLSGYAPSSPGGYGTLSLTGDGTILHKGKEITGFPELAKSCLSEAYAGKE